MKNRTFFFAIFGLLVVIFCFSPRVWVNFCPAQDVEAAAAEDVSGEDALADDAEVDEPVEDVKTPAETDSEKPAPAKENASPAETPSSPPPSPSTEASPAESADAFKEKSRVTDVHLQAVETLQIPDELQEEAKKLAAEYVDVFCKHAAMKYQVQFAELEVERIQGLTGEGGALRRFLANMTVLDDPEFSELEVLGKPIAQAMVAGGKPAVADMVKAGENLKNQVQEEREMWHELHDTLVQRQFLLFEIESNRHVVTQLASMLSVDKRWFWLFAVFAFGCLVMVSFHERRHEIRRWLNGGKARQMRLSKILLGCFIALLTVTFITFIFGETIYRAMLDVTFSTTSPRRVAQHGVDEEKSLLKALAPQSTAAKENLVEQKDAWRQFAIKNLPQGTSKDLLAQWNAWRDAVEVVYLQTGMLREISRQVETDRQALVEINGRMRSTAGETLHYLRYKHLLRVVLGMCLLLVTFFGIAYYWAEVNRRQKHIYNTCPYCLHEGFLQKWEPAGAAIALAMGGAAPGGGMPGGAAAFGIPAPGMPANEIFTAGQGGDTAAPQTPAETGAARMVECTHVVSESPHEVCGYRFEAALRPLIKLSFPTLGVPQVGKTHWLTMLYWEIQNGYYPHLGFQNIPTSVTEEMDRRVDEIMNARIGTAATQRDRIPQPLVLKYRDTDPLGRTELLANIFDYSGEVTTDTPLDDPRRERALLSDGFFFFLDPLYPWQPQAEALKRFRLDMQELMDLEKDESLHLPIAICLTKIDLLPLVTSLPNAEEEAIRFYETLGQIDPTGEALNKAVIDARSEATDALRKRIWPEWDVEQQVKDLFGGRHKFFPLTPVGLDGAGETDLRRRTIAPFGLIDPLAWLLEMSGYTTLK